VIRRYRHAQLLFMLVVLLVVNPFVEGMLVFAVVDLIMVATLISAVIACAARRSHVIVGVTLAAIVLGSSWYRTLSGIDSVTILYSVFALSFFGYVTALILTDVFRDSRAVSVDTICGALAAYMLLGVAWAFAYALLEAVLPGSIAGLREEGFANGYQQYLGYSFVTLTTLGYGNVVPANAQAEALASGEAIAGQVYLTVLVARLVALNLLSERGRPEGDGQDQKQT
jgi:hypothetical protein